MVLPEALPEGGAMLDAEDAGAERPREAQLFDGRRLFGHLALGQLHHDGRQALAHLWMELRRRHGMPTPSPQAVRSSRKRT